MPPVGRNAPCPCGSAKKSKRCCGVAVKAQIPQTGNIAGVIVDPGRSQVMFFTKDILLNQLRRNSPRIAQSFDQMFANELEDISSELGRIATILEMGALNNADDKDDVRTLCGLLLVHASHDIVAAIELLRNGYRLQPGALLRTSIEGICAVAHLFSKPEDLERFQRGKLESSQTIAQAKKVIPALGQLWGQLSNEFAHIGSLRHQVVPIKDYDDPQESPAVLNILVIKLVIYSLSIVSELVFFDEATDRRFWESPNPGQLVFRPNEAGKRFYGDFLGRLKSRYKVNLDSDTAKAT